MAYKPHTKKTKVEKKQCFFCTNDIDVVDFKEAAGLKSFLTHQYKIASKTRTGNCSKHQRRVANAIKRARIAGLLPFTQHVR